MRAGVPAPRRHPRGDAQGHGPHQDLHELHPTEQAPVRGQNCAGHWLRHGHPVAVCGQGDPAARPCMRAGAAQGSSRSPAVCLAPCAAHACSAPCLAGDSQAAARRQPGTPTGVRTHKPGPRPLGPATPAPHSSAWCTPRVQAGAKHVYGIECSSIAEQAKQIVSDNGFEGQITIVHGKVEEVELPVDKVSPLCAPNKPTAGQRAAVQAAVQAALQVGDWQPERWRVPSSRAAGCGGGCTLAAAPRACGAIGSPARGLAAALARDPAGLGAAGGGAAATRCPLVARRWTSSSASGWATSCCTSPCSTQSSGRGTSGSSPAVGGPPAAAPPGPATHDPTTAATFLAARLAMQACVRSCCPGPCCAVWGGLHGDAHAATHSPTGREAAGWAQLARPAGCPPPQRNRPRGVWHQQPAHCWGLNLGGTAPPLQAPSSPTRRRCTLQPSRTGSTNTTRSTSGTMCECVCCCCCCR